MNTLGQATVFMTRPRGGHFYTTKKKIELMVHRRTEQNVALDDGAPDPHYCYGFMKITRFSKDKSKKGHFNLQGDIRFGDGTERFIGNLKPNKIPNKQKRDFSCSFTFIE